MANDSGAVRPSRGLVLGGGGPVGRAWQVGLVDGFAGQGIDLGTADLIIGTSAGAVVGAQLAMKQGFGAPPYDTSPPASTNSLNPKIVGILAAFASLIIWYLLALVSGSLKT